MSFKIFKLGSSNSDKYYLGFYDKNKYLSKRIHPFIQAYKKYINKESFKYKPLFEVIENDNIFLTAYDDNEYTTEIDANEKIKILSALDNCVNNNLTKELKQLEKINIITIKNEVKLKPKNENRNVDYHKKYYLENKEQYKLRANKNKDYFKKYYENKKDKIKQQSKIRSLEIKAKLNRLKELEKTL